jgi:hypothetical protein
MDLARQKGMIVSAYVCRARSLTANGIFSRESRISRSSRLWQHSSG